MPGSKPGERRGGRAKGTKNKTTVALEQDLAAGGELPRDYMLRVMRDKTNDHGRRDDMAKAVAPYVHAKLQSTTIAGDPDGAPIQVETSMDLNDLARRTAFLLTQAARAKKKG